MPQHTSPSTTRFAGYSDPVLRSGPSEDSAPVQHLLWGDWIRLRSGRDGEWREVYSRDLGSVEPQPGFNEVSWDQTDSHGSGLASGVYWATLEIAGSRSVKKFSLVR